MILISVLLISAVPYIIQLLFGVEWIPLLIMTAIIFFFVELIPQYLMLRQPLAYGYFFWPFIWAMMWSTAPLSWPIAWCLDKIVLPRPERDMYSQEELSQLIKLHERREKHGGKLGPDPGRIMRGALELDGRTMKEPYATADLADGITTTAEQWDLEVANSGRTGVIVPWAAVKYVKIDEEVDDIFVKKLKGWAYSRIPVVGDNEVATKPEGTGFEDWDGKRVFGFLHIKVSRADVSPFFTC